MKFRPKGILGYIEVWLIMILLAVFMPILHLFKYSIVFEAERK